MLVCLNIQICNDIKMRIITPKTYSVHMQSKHSISIELPT